MESSTPEQSFKPTSLWVGAGLGALSAIAVIALMYWGEQTYNLPFVPYEIFDWMTRTLPGGLLAFVVGNMVKLISFLQGFMDIGSTDTVAKAAENAIAILQLIGGGVAFGLILAWLNRDRTRNLIAAGQIGGLLLLAASLVIIAAVGITPLDGNNVIWLTILFVAWGWGLAYLVNESAPALASAPQANLSRRQFLTVSGAGLSAVALGAWGLGQIFGKENVEQVTSTGPVLSGDDPFGASLTSGPAASPSPEELAARPEAVQGTRDELTSNAEFYRIDINSRPPEVNAEGWAVDITGLVDDEVRLNIDDIRALPAQTQILTMQCISNRVGGDLTSSSRWTGARFKDVLDLAGVQGGVTGALIKSVDGFFEFVVMEDIMDDRTLLVYEMNGEPLPVEHGFPLRIYIPDRYGMKQPKWIESIELRADRVDGYWVVRGWDQEARPRTVSVVDTVVVDPNAGDGGTAYSGGIAWAGARGISRVEVQVDSANWQDAELVSPPLSELNWVLWRYNWPYAAGRHTVRVRAYDGSGELQITENMSTRPSGATGIHSITVDL